MNVFKTFNIEAAHYLPGAPAGHKCRNIHGHSFVIEIHVWGAVNEEAGWVIDFADIKEAFEPISDKLDHSFLNEISGLENPTSENIARWIWNKLNGLNGLRKVVVRETCSSGCEYYGEG